MTSTQEAEICRRYTEDHDATTTLGAVYGVGARVIYGILLRNGVTPRTRAQSIQYRLKVHYSPPEKPVRETPFSKQCTTARDGHIFWVGSGDTWHRHPVAAWAWFEQTGALPGPRERVVSTCGLESCINPEHLRLEKKCVK